MGGDTLSIVQECAFGVESGDTDGAAALGEASGPPAGVMPGTVWTDNEMRLSAGETVVLTTDGITEARCDEGAGCAYGSARLGAFVSARARLAVKALVEAVYADVRQFCAPAPPHDDCMLLALRYRG
jgi:phosphoserine phosphatase RsbU/P